MTRVWSPVSPPCVSLLFLVGCVWDGAVCSAGGGRRQWRRPSDPPSRSSSLPGAFPPGFLWGAGTSAFQTEGSWDRDGKGPSVWDHFTHDGRAGPRDTADTASDSYARWAEDAEALRYLGARVYAFSLSWPRLFPDGLASGRPNAAAVAHYGRLIGGLRARGVEPVATLFHWDLPRPLQERHGGWRNQSTAQAFADYAAFCFGAFGGQVRLWLTMHNPYLLALQGYGTGAHAPGETGDPAAPFTVAHNLIRAHAKAWHVYNTRFRPHQNGQVSITLGSHWIEPIDLSAANVDLCQQSMEAVIGWFAEPIHGSGDYPASLKASNRGLIPEFTPEEKLWVRGTADFFSLAFDPHTVRGRGLPRFGQTVSLDLRRVLGWVGLEYGDPRVLVAESGWFSDAAKGVEDTVAMYMMKRFIYQVLQAIVLDNVKVFGYTAWSLVDGFEWNYGYSMRRGLFYVDFTNPNRTRIPKTTAKFYKQVITDNGFPSDGKIEGHFPCNFHWGVADSILAVHLHPFSPQFTDTNLYRWNFTGDGSLRPVPGVTLHTRGPQCTDFLSIRRHLRLLEVTGTSHYRFALDWSLLLPRGDLSSLDKEVLRYYRCVLTELRRLGIRAAVTLYHPSQRSPSLGMPGPLQAAGGWLNSTTAEAFVGYATLCFRELGTWVSVWITVNEPNRLAEVYDGSAADRQLATRHLLLAHARAWRLYDARFRRRQGATVTFALHADWAEPANPFLEADEAAAQRFLLFELGRFLDPLLRGGDYPAEVREYLEERGHGSGGSDSSPLPPFTELERVELGGALDFIALNHFTTRLVSPLRDAPPQHPGPDHGCSFLYDPTWPSSGLRQALVPWGLRRVLRWVKGRYGDARSVIVTAAGVDDQASQDDQLRQSYVRSYLQEALKARELDGVDLRGFYVWKLQDRPAPQQGRPAPLFGLFSSSHLQSRPKGSVSTYREIITRGGFPGNDTTPTSCQLAASDRTTCAICAKIAENKPLLFFGVCVLLSGSMLTVAIIVTITRKRRARRAPAHAAPHRLKRQQWERFAMQRVANTIRGPHAVKQYY